MEKRRPIALGVSTVVTKRLTDQSGVAMHARAELPPILSEAAGKRSEGKE